MTRPPFRSLRADVRVHFDHRARQVVKSASGAYSRFRKRVLLTQGVLTGNENGEVFLKLAASDGVRHLLSYHPSGCTDLIAFRSSLKRTVIVCEISDTVTEPIFPRMRLPRFTISVELPKQGGVVVKNNSKTPKGSTSVLNIRNYHLEFLRAEIHTLRCIREKNFVFF